MKADPDSKVRYQLLLTLGEMVAERIERTRTEILFNDIEDEWMQYAGLSAKQLDITALFNKAITTFKANETAATTSFFRRMSEVI